MTEFERGVVLIVESERDLAERYMEWLRSDYDVRVARNGSEAVSQLDGDIDVVIIGLETSDMSCEEILDEIANRDVDCRVAMVGGADPGFDGTSIGFDEYLTTPLTGDELRDTVERLVGRVSLDDDLQEYASLVRQKAEVETEHSAGERETNDEADDLEDRIESTEQTVDDSLGDLSSDKNFISAVREIDGSEGRASTQNDDGET
jgi:DNA-binding response OmpR family regulator